MAKESNAGLWLAALGAIGAATVGVLAARKSSAEQGATQGPPESMGWAAARESRRRVRLGKRDCGCEGGR